MTINERLWTIGLIDEFDKIRKTNKARAARQGYAVKKRQNIEATLQ